MAGSTVFMSKTLSPESLLTLMGLCETQNKQNKNSFYFLFIFPLPIPLALVALLKLSGELRKLFWIYSLGGQK